MAGTRCPPGRVTAPRRRQARLFLGWSTERGLEPPAAQRPHIELYIRWVQEVRRFKPSTVSRRISIVAGFYRTCVIDGVLPTSPAEHVRRPNVPPESPTLGLTHLQSEAMLTAARESGNPNDFARVAMLGLLGLRIFEAPAQTSPTSAMNTDTASWKSTAKATGSCWCRSRRRSGAWHPARDRPD